MTMLSFKGMKNGLAIILLILVSFSPFCEVFNFASSNIEGHMAGFIYWHDQEKVRRCILTNVGKDGTGFISVLIY